MIGRPLTEMLVDSGACVRVVSLDGPSLCPAGAEFMRADLIRWEDCRRAVKDMDFVFHLAGVKGSVGIGVSRSASFMVPTLLFNTHMLEAARQAKVERFLYTSSVCVYPPAELFREDDAFRGPPDDTDRFAAYAKRAGELQAQAYGLEYGWTKIAIVRPANTYGPGDDFDPATGLVIPSLIARAAEGEDPLVVWGDGTAVRDFLYAADCARGMMLALEKAACLVPVNLGSGRGYSIRETAETICSLVPHPPRVRWDRSKTVGGKRRVMDIRRARRMLGFHPEVSLKQGLRKTIEWYLSHKDKGRKGYNVFRDGNCIIKGR